MDDPRMSESDDVTEHDLLRYIEPTGEMDDVIGFEGDFDRFSMKKSEDGASSSSKDNLDYRRQLTLMFRSLKARSTEINNLIKERRPALQIKEIYTKWQYSYHEFLATCENYFKTLSRYEYTQYAYEGLRCKMLCIHICEFCKFTLF